VVVLNKADMLEVFEFDLAFFKRGLVMVNPDAPLFVVSSKTGQGIDEWLAWLLDRRSQVMPGEMTGPRREGERF
jgi:hydrogenase nickel incorporation protein HypB